LQRLQPLQSQHIARPIEAERSAEIALDQPCGEQGFAHIAEGEGGGTPEVPVARNIGNDGCDDYATGDRHPCVAPQRDQHAGGHARSRPEPGNAVSFAEQRKAQLRCEEIVDADRNGEPDRTSHGCDVGMAGVLRRTFWLGPCSICPHAAATPSSVILFGN